MPTSLSVTLVPFGKVIDGSFPVNTAAAPWVTDMVAVPLRPSGLSAPGA